MPSIIRKNPLEYVKITKTQFWLEWLFKNKESNTAFIILVNEMPSVGISNVLSLEIACKLMQVGN